VPGPGVCESTFGANFCSDTGVVNVIGVNSVAGVPGADSVLGVMLYRAASLVGAKLQRTVAGLASTDC
jgi:hypothetical protein